MPRARSLCIGLLIAGCSSALTWVSLSSAARTGEVNAAAAGPGWVKGKGYGWIWGEKDELGAMNTSNDSTRAAALKLAKTGQTYDLGVTYSRNSFKWPGHSPGEIMTFRSPEGVLRQKDFPFIGPETNPAVQGWHSCALFINDNVGTQIDGLGHVTIGKDHHWYNGFREGEWGGDFGIQKCSAAGIPPIIARGVMLDIAGLKNMKALPPHYAITPADVDAACKKQNVELRPGDVVLFRTGTLQFWGADGADIETLKEYDTAGINLETARYLIEHKGSLLLGSDTSGLEVAPAPEGSDTFIPVHKYLLIEQGVHIGEFHYLEDLARDKVSEFCYVATTAKIAGSVAGFALRPLAIR